MGGCVAQRGEVGGVWIAQLGIVTCNGYVAVLEVAVEEGDESLWVFKSYT